MISTLNVKCNAAKPNFPLQPMFAFMGSPSSLRILDVPKSIGNWAITSVKVVVTYPDNIMVEKNAVRNGSVWVATVEGCNVAGKVANGYEVLADGKDEDGNDVTGYVLGKGDVYIIENDTDISRLLDKIAVRYVEDIPDVPTKGDLMNSNGELRLFDGNNWILISTGEHSSVYDSQITIQKNGSSVGSFTTNSEVPVSIDIPVPSRTSDIENDVGYITTNALPTKVSELENDSGFITLAQVPTPSYIEDANGNKIEADLDCNVKDFTLPWTLVDGQDTYTLNYDEQTSKWRYEEAETKKIELSYSAQYSIWELDFYLWNNDEWDFDTGSTTTQEKEATTLTILGWTLTRSIMKSDKLAKESDLPTKTSDLVNDSGFITASAIPSNVGAFTNDAGYLTAASRTITNLEIKNLNHEQRLRVTEKDATGAREYMDLSYPTVNADAQDGFGIASFKVYFPEYDGKAATEATLGTITESSGTVWWGGAMNLEVKSSDGIHFSYYNNGGWSELPVNANGTEAWTYFYAQGIRPAYVTPSFKSNTMKKIALEDYVNAQISSAIPSNVSELNNDAGYLTSSSTAFTEKRDKTDMDVKGIPRDVGNSHFNVTDGTTTNNVWWYDEGRWLSGQTFDVIATSTPDQFELQKNQTTVGTFTLDSEFKASVVDGGTTYTIVGYKGSLVVSDELDRKLYGTDSKMATKDYVDDQIGAVLNEQF